MSTQTLDQIKELEKFSEFAKKAIVEAFEFARQEDSELVTPQHIFIGILTNPKNVASRLLSKLGVDTDRTLESFKEQSKFVPNPKFLNMKLDDGSKEILVQSFVIASEMSHIYVGTEHILLSLLKNEHLSFVKDLQNVGLDFKSVLKSLMAYATYQPGIFTQGGDATKGEEEESVIETFAQDMNELAKDGRYMPIYGREDEVERVIHILSRRTKSNPILVGEAGVGKTAIVEGLAQRIVDKNVPISFEKKRIVNLDIAGILAGSKIRGDVEERILAIVAEASEDPNMIIFIDEIHMIIGAGSSGQGSMDIANILKPYLTNSDISVIGATTLNEYQKYFETDSALTRRFQPVNIDEIGKDEAILVLDNIRKKLEDFHHVNITSDAVVEAVELSARYISDRYLPDKAIDILDEAAAGKKISSESRKNKYVELKKEYEEIQKKKDKAIDSNKMDEAADLRKQEVDIDIKMKKMEKSSSKSSRPKVYVDGDDIRRVVARLTKIPVEKMDSGVVKSLLNVEKLLEKNIIGQPDAIKKVASAIKRARVGIGSQNKPLGSFLFLGPTGVGKTELAKTIATELFGSESALIQIDMSEYMEQHSVSKLIGSPPGYVGFSEGGQLTEKIRRQPYSVVLFDEIEKAHPELLNILLQVLDEGGLQDSKGRRINFKNTIIIMTSNIGAAEVMNDKVLGFNLDFDTSNDEDEGKMDEAFNEMRDELLEELKDTLRPELLNRIDDTIVFRGLNDTDILDIVKLEINKLNERINKKNLAVAVSQGAIKFVAEEGADKEYGARNVKRKIQELIENPLAEFVLEKNLTNPQNMSVVKVNKAGDGLTLSLN